MSCIVCASVTELKCKQCKLPYCGSECQILDWPKHKRRCAFIAGKRKHEESEEPCRNDQDPFSLDDISDIDERDLIQIDGNCFHLPNLYEWIGNMGNKTNPFTNLNFSDEELAEIENQANIRFSLLVTKRAIFGPSEIIELNSLMSVTNLIMRIFNHIAKTNVTTAYELLSHIANMGYLLMLKFDDEGKTYHDAEAMTRFGHEQVKNITESDNIIVYVQQYLNPFMSLKHAKEMRDWAVHNKKPTHIFDAIIERAETTISKAEANKLAREELRKELQEKRMQLGIDYIEKPEGTTEVVVRVLTKAGDAFGAYSLFLKPSEKLIEIIKKSMVDYDIIGTIDDEGKEPIKLPGDALAKFIYGGRLYGGSTRLSDLPNFKDGNVITVTTVSK